MPRRLDKRGNRGNQTFAHTILIDTREQLAYTFAEIPGWKITTSSLALASGDYSLDGYAAAVAVERKSKRDLFGTLGSGRNRFIRELERLNELTFSAVVVESEWSEIINDPPFMSRLNPKTIYASVLAWQQRYPRVHWWFVADRDMGEMTTFRILERFVREQQENSFRKAK